MITDLKDAFINSICSFIRGTVCVQSFFLHFYSPGISWYLLLSNLKDNLNKFKNSSLHGTM